jgi:hypothetical protein
VRFRDRKDEERNAQTRWLLRELKVTPFGPALELAVIDRGEIKKLEKRLARDRSASWKTPFPAYRDTTDLVRAIYYQRALEEHGRTFTFTVHFSPEVLATSKSKLIDFAHRRIARHFKEYVGHPVPFWFAIELSEITHFPHFHGAFAIDDQRLPTAREALRAASRLGRTPPTPRAVRIDPITYGPGWTWYSLKNPSHTEYVFECKVLSATVEVRKRAEEHYKADQAVYLGAVRP